MDIFSTDDEVYATIGALCQRMLDDPAMGPMLKGLGITMGFGFREPDAQIIFNCSADPPRIDFGPVEYGIDVLLSLTASDGHRLWLGTIDPIRSMFTRRIRPSGDVLKAMAIKDLLRPAHEMYRQLLPQIGRADLLEV